MQLEEIGDDLMRRTNAACSKLVKIKTNTGLRVKAAVEKEFIEARIAGIATKKIDLSYERSTKEIRIMGLMKRKNILGSFFTTVERDDTDLLKEIAKRAKLEAQKLEAEKLKLLELENISNENNLAQKEITDIILDKDNDQDLSTNQA